VVRGLQELQEPQARMAPQALLEQQEQPVQMVPQELQVLRGLQVLLEMREPLGLQEL
jgi:hypothetical protein